MAKKVRRRTVKREPEPVLEPHRDQPAHRADVEQALAQLRSYHALGTESLTENPDRVTYGESSELLRKARVFAQRYTLEDLIRIETLCRQHGTALGRSLIDRLATVHDREARRELEEEAIAGRWSKILVDREIRKRFGRRRTLGRKPKPPTTPEEALAEIVGLCLKMVRWGEAVGWSSHTGRIVDCPAITQLPEDILNELRQTLRAAYRLQTSAEKKLASRRS